MASWLFGLILFVLEAVYLLIPIQPLGWINSHNHDINAHFLVLLR